MERLPAELREAVHEYGMAIVRVLVKYGINRKAQIDEVVREIWEGARSTGQKRSPGTTLDWYFMKAGVDINTATLLRILNNNCLIIVPKSATREMIEASMQTVASHNMIVTKREKHHLRLDAALEAGSKHLTKLRHQGHKDKVA